MNLLSEAQIVAGNRVTLLKNGEEFFPALIAAIDSAAYEVRLETYIFRDDASGTRIAASLTRAAQRGARVHVLIDGVGSGRTSPLFFESMRTAGVSVLVYRPESDYFNFRSSRLRRTHRKIGLIDGKVGFVGGINLIDDLTESLSEFPRYDYAVRIEGPVLADIYLETERLWRLVTWRKFKRPEKSGPLPHFSKIVPTPTPGGTKVIFAIRDNFRHRRDIERAYLRAINGARREILLTSPYFLPGRHFRRALMQAAKRNVSVTLLLQGRADHVLLQEATRALYTQLLGAGVTIFEYHKSMLHGKIAVVDNSWSTIGSSNLDPFSLLLNREANVMVIDEAFAVALRSSVMQEIAVNAEKLDPAQWQKRRWGARVRSWFAYGFTRWVSGLLGLGRRRD